MKKYDLIFSNFAENDLYEIIKYYLDINPKFARELYFKIKIKINELVYYPLKGKIVPELEKQGIVQYRQLLEGNYRIIYKVTEKRIEVLIIVDTRRDLENILIVKLSEINDVKEKS